jgi:hypothetical protein
MQTTVAETNTERMIGLSASDANANFTSIQFAFYLSNGGALRIYESGTDRGGFGAYSNGDILKIAVENNVVKYYRNTTVLFTSSVAPTLPLFVDVSNNSIGATANNVKISNGSLGIFNAIGTNLGTAPVYQWKLNGVNVGSNSTSYTNNSLNNNDVLFCSVTPDLGGCFSSNYSSNSLTIVEPTIGSTTWSGATNDWNTASNWSNGVPNKYMNAIIASGTNPIINTNANVNSLTINSGRSLTIFNSSLSLDIYGNISNSGTFIPNNSTVTIYGCSSPTTITSVAGITFSNLIINNSAGVILGGTNNVTVSTSLNLINGVVTTGSNNLILSNSIASNLTYSNGFVFGNFRRRIVSNTSTYFFPIGNGTNPSDRHLAAFINNNLTGITSITGSVNDFIQISPNNDASLNTTQNGTVINSTIGETTGQTVIWNFSPIGARTGGNFGIRLYVENTTLNSSDDNQFCPLRRTNTTSYVNFLTEDASTTIPSGGSAGRIFSSGNGFAQRSGYTALDQFTIGKSGLGPLPVELTSFEANCNNEEVILKWTTASEVNNDYFELERINGDVKPVSITKIKGAGNSKQTKYYQFIDSSPNQGINYYRLKQTDLDGQYKYSETISVNCNNKSNQWSNIYPNPGQKELYIETIDPNYVKQTYKIYDSKCQLISEGILEQKVNIQTTEFSSGIYLILLENGESFKWVKF